MSGIPRLGWRFSVFIIIYFDICLTHEKIRLKFADYIKWKNVFEQRTCLQSHLHVHILAAWAQKSW